VLVRDVNELIPSIDVVDASCVVVIHSRDIKGPP